MNLDTELGFFQIRMIKRIPHTKLYIQMFTE